MNKISIIVINTFELKYFVHEKNLSWLRFESR